MPLRPVRFLPLGVALAVAGCDLSVPTEVQEPIELALDFCANDVPVWFAYQNQEGPTTRVLPDADGTFRFTASNRLVVGLVWQRGADYHTEIISATNRELETMSGVACLEESGTKTVNGTVAGVSSGQIAVVGMNFASAPLQSGNTSYSLVNLPDRPLDLVATRQNVTGNSRIADRLIIRRTQTFVNNGTVPALDFVSGSDVIQPTALNATVSGIFANDVASLQSNFFSQLETSHSLSYMESVANGAAAFASVPGTALASGDYHDIILLAVSAADGSVRGAENFFRAPLAQTLALGPALSEPIITPVPNDEFVRLRVQLGLQNSYDDGVSVTFRQQLPLSVTSVTLTSTVGHLRTVIGSWLLEIPDLTGAPGWQDAWGLKTGNTIHWTVTAFGGRPELMFGAKPNDGEFVRYAIRASQPGAMAPWPAGMPRALRSR